MMTSCNPLQSSARLLYDRKEAARQLSISVRSLDYLISDNRLRGKRVGGRVLVSADELRRFAQSDQPAPVVSQANRKAA
jgi:excisionase family DNA binding protein